jgi:hypothetical protein
VEKYCNPLVTEGESVSIMIKTSKIFMLLMTVEKEIVGNSHVEYLLTVIRDVIRSRQPAKISGNSSCHRRLLFLFKKNNERKSSISNTTYSACIYWSACLRLQIFKNKHRYISSNPNNISRYFPLIGDEIIDGQGMNYPGYIFSFFSNFF